MIINGCRPGTLPDLPSGFAEKYTSETCSSDSPEDFHSKEELLTLSKLQHDAIKAALKIVTEDELDQPGPESMKDYAPTWGAGFSLIGDHWLMHAGQWAVIRRQNGRKPMF